MMKKAKMFIIVFMVLSSAIVSAGAWDTILGVFSGGAGTADQFTSAQAQMGPSEIGGDETCIEDDDGMTPFVPGKAIGRIGEKIGDHYDYCLDDYTLMERSCSGKDDLVRNNKIDCRPGYCEMTEQGAKCSSIPICIDFDPANVKTKPGFVMMVNTVNVIPRFRLKDFFREHSSGTLDTGLNIYPDECVEDQTTAITVAIKQYSCSDGQLVETIEDCVEGQECEAAIQDGQVITPGAKCVGSEGLVTSEQADVVTQYDPALIIGGGETDIEINVGQTVVLDGVDVAFDGIDVSVSQDVEQGSSFDFAGESFDIEITSIDTEATSIDIETAASGSQAAAGTQAAIGTQAATDAQAATESVTDTQAASSSIQLGEISSLLGRL